jgi:hypothetical protein
MDSLSLNDTTASVKSKTSHTQFDKLESLKKRIYFKIIINYKNRN